MSPRCSAASGGRTSVEIADKLFISILTAAQHIQNIYTKIGVSNRASATWWAATHLVVPGGLESPKRVH